MASANEENMIVGLDIGTSKVVAIVGAIGANGDLEIVGTGMHVSSGLKKGVVVNIEATVNSIQRAVEEAELMAGCSIHSVYAGIAGSHIRSLNSHGIVAIRDREVQQLDERTAYSQIYHNGFSQLPIGLSAFLGILKRCIRLVFRATLFYGFSFFQKTFCTI